jgi:hypothetical protein
MYQVESSCPPGLIGLSCGELARYTEFHAAFDGLMAPVGSDRGYGIGYDTASNSNDVIRQMEPHHQWVSIYDDDHWFQPDVLLRMLEHRVDLIVPLYYMRRPPFLPVLYITRESDGSCVPYQYADLKGRHGLIDDPVSAGKSGVTISRHLLSTLAGGACVCPPTSAEDWRHGKRREHDPGCAWRTHAWFYTEHRIGEDHVFYRDCLKAGFKLHCDLDVRLEHFNTFRIRPNQDEETGEWFAEIDLYNNVRVRVRVTPKAD